MHNNNFDELQGGFIDDKFIGGYIGGSVGGSVGGFLLRFFNAF